MFSGSIGFIGGGRITAIMLKGFQNAGLRFNSIVVSDTSQPVLEELKVKFPEICISHNDNNQAARQDLVFISLHPPVIAELLHEIKQDLRPGAIIVSLAPKFTISRITKELDGFSRIARVIPNAPSILNTGYNPASFSTSFSGTEKEELLNLLSSLGKCPEVAEEKLEAYAILTAMGPTYFWFQLYELRKIVMEFGLNNEEAAAGIKQMLNGAVETMFSGLEMEKVIDLVPVKPLGEEEENIREIYRQKLFSVYGRIKP